MRSLPILELVDVEKSYVRDGAFALTKTSLSILSGEFIFIQGQSGSGKSTLLSILGCLDRPSAGTYKIRGTDVCGLADEEMARLRNETFGFVFQQFQLISYLTVRHNVELPAIYAGLTDKVRKECAVKLLDKVGLSDRVDFVPSQLSGGQQQRVSIARALMNDGEVIIADEPTGSLDPKNGSEILELLVALNRAGRTIIVASHDPVFAKYADRIFTVTDGQVVATTERLDRCLVPCVNIRDGALCRDARPDAGGVNQGSTICSQTHDIVRMAWRALLLNKIRSSLAVLSIVIGTLSIVVVLALGAGARRSVIAEIRSLGAERIDIYPGFGWGDQDARSVHTLVSSDVAFLSSQNYLNGVTPVIMDSETIRYGDHKAKASVVGVSAQYFRIGDATLAEGEGFDDLHVMRRSQVAVIDANTRHRLFKDWEDPIGETIFIGSLPCVVIGVLRDRDGLLGASTDLQLFLPFTSVATRLTGKPWFDSIAVRTRTGVQIDLAMEAMERLLERRHGKRDFFTDSNQGIVTAAGQTARKLGLLTFSLALITFIVGGIGVMNVMLASVAERLHEIGIRKAVGAKRGEIVKQFVCEAVIICMVGGTIGVALSYLIIRALSLQVGVFELHVTVESAFTAWASSALIGAVFGIWPAERAARISPAYALAQR